MKLEASVCLLLPCHSLWQCLETDECSTPGWKSPRKLKLCRTISPTMWASQAPVLACGAPLFGTFKTQRLNNHHRDRAWTTWESFTVKFGSGGGMFGWCGGRFRRYFDRSSMTMTKPCFYPRHLCLIPVQPPSCLGSGWQWGSLVWALASK